MVFCWGLRDVPQRFQGSLINRFQMQTYIESATRMIISVKPIWLRALQLSNCKKEIKR